MELNKGVQVENDLYALFLYLQNRVYKRIKKCDVPLGVFLSKYFLYSIAC